MDINVAPEAVHYIDTVVRLEFPRSSGERVGKVVQCSDRAEINNISRKFIGHHALNISGDLVSFTSADLSKREFTCNLLSKSDTTCAVNASSHRGLDQRSNILVLNGSFVLHHPALCVTVDGRDILKIAFTTLVTDGTVEGVVCQ